MGAISSALPACDSQRGKHPNAGGLGRVVASVDVHAKGELCANANLFIFSVL